MMLEAEINVVSNFSFVPEPNGGEGGGGGVGEGIKWNFTVSSNLVVGGEG